MAKPEPELDLFVERRSELAHRELELDPDVFTDSPWRVIRSEATWRQPATAAAPRVDFSREMLIAIQGGGSVTGVWETPHAVVVGFRVRLYVQPCDEKRESGHSRKGIIVPATLKGVWLHLEYGDALPCKTPGVAAVTSVPPPANLPLADGTGRDRCTAPGGEAVPHVLLQHGGGGRRALPASSPVVIESAAAFKRLLGFTATGVDWKRQRVVALHSIFEAGDSVVAPAWLVRTGSTISLGVITTRRAPCQGMASPPAFQSLEVLIALPRGPETIVVGECRSVDCPPGIP